jgi:hypothetical protein
MKIVSAPGAGNWVVAVKQSDLAARYTVLNVRTEDSLDCASLAQAEQEARKRNALEATQPKPQYRAFRDPRAPGICF